MNTDILNSLVKVSDIDHPNNDKWGKVVSLKENIASIDIGPYSERTIKPFIITAEISSIEKLNCEYTEKLTHAMKAKPYGQMVPSVFKVLIDGNQTYGFNFQKRTSKIGDRFHYDYGYGIEKNNDAEIVWLKA